MTPDSPVQQEREWRIYRKKNGPWRAALAKQDAVLGVDGPDTDGWVTVREVLPSTSQPSHKAREVLERLRLEADVNDDYLTATLCADLADKLEAALHRDGPPSPEQIERGARALYEADPWVFGQDEVGDDIHKPWADAPSSVHDRYRSDAEAVLAAALKEGENDG